MLGRESVSVLGELGAVPLTAERLREDLKGIGELFERLVPWDAIVLVAVVYPGAMATQQNKATWTRCSASHAIHQPPGEEHLHWQ